MCDKDHIPEAVRRLPDEWRADAKKQRGFAEEMFAMDEEVSVCMSRADTRDEDADELEAALAQHSEPGRIPDGYCLVPVEPTKEMLNAGREEVYEGCGYDGCGEGWEGSHADCYRAMLAAAPAPDAEKNDAD